MSRSDEFFTLGIGAPRATFGSLGSLAARLGFLRVAGPLALPRPVRQVISRLRAHGFEAYAVGGAVRNLLLGRRPGDWDVGTSAEPIYVLSIFLEAIPTGLDHGTVTVLSEGDLPVDVTTFRSEGRYSDRRHPDTVSFGVSLREDLSRRDFTVNAMALGWDGRVVDPFGGLYDLARRVVRCVGDPGARFSEDALRMMRAVRLCVELDFHLDPATATAIGQSADLLGHIAVERVREEFDRCLVSVSPGRALELLRRLGLLRHIVPELLDCVGFEQEEGQEFSVWEHTLLTVEGTPPRLDLRLAALLHDVAKPRTCSEGPERRRFEGHERVGAEMAAEILARLRYDRATTDRVVHLVRNHLALRPPREVRDAVIRRLINRVGPEHVPDLVDLRRADCLAARSGSGSVDRATAAYLVRVERVLRRERVFTLRDLAVGGEDVMRVARIGPGPQVGVILRRLLEEVLENPQLNEKSRLEARIREMTDPVRPRSTR
ncbi:MAG: HD domain-containing protein [Firmicutes bacterium]|nr:HD domain-containing protein [Bacillota bacterium]